MLRDKVCSEGASGQRAPEHAEPNPLMTLPVAGVPFCAFIFVICIKGRLANGHYEQSSCLSQERRDFTAFCGSAGPIDAEVSVQAQSSQQQAANSSKQQLKLRRLMRATPAPALITRTSVRVEAAPLQLY
jgi:hypothetical protein